MITYVVCEASVNSEFAKLEDCIISICAAMASFDSILSQSSVLYIKKKIKNVKQQKYSLKKKSIGYYYY